MDERKSSGDLPVKPGTGGRRPRATAFTPTTATAALYRELGDPTISQHQGTTMMVWVVDKRGDGILNARLSGQELQGGETALGQVHPLRALADQLERRVRLIVVTINNSGAKAFDDRPDFILTKREIDAGRVRWVAWRGTDRIAREETPFFMYRDLLRDSGTTLILGNLGRAIDFRHDRYQLNMQNTAAADERDLIYMRTHGAIHSRWVLEGRGWPSSGGYGFRRNTQTKFPRSTLSSGSTSKRSTSSTSSPARASPA
jgi:hypothetical protein